MVVAIFKPYYFSFKLTVLGENFLDFFVCNISDISVILHGVNCILYVCLNSKSFAYVIDYLSSSLRMCSKDIERKIEYCYGWTCLGMLR